MLIAGVDEAGRGPLAGPVVAAAVILDPASAIPGLADSKLLTAKRREVLLSIIQEQAIAWAVADASVAEIDTLNILQASLLAMQRAVQALTPAPELAMIDGNKVPKLVCAAQAIVQGDRLIPAISAASILAKVMRDRMMLDLDQEYPQYGFAIHKGYPTKAHIAAIKQYGVTAWHRRSFAPVKAALSCLL